MINFSAIIPSAQMDSANAELESLGFGPKNFSVAAFGSSGRPDFALFSTWHDSKFRAAVETIPNVTIVDGGEPIQTASAAAAAVGARWAADAMPLTGLVSTGLHVDANGAYWYVITPYDTAQYPNPLLVPALVVPARMPYEITEWVQPLNQFTAYYLSNPFTSAPDEVYFGGDVYYVSQADGAGLNVWRPDEFGWTKK